MTAYQLLRKWMLDLASASLAEISSSGQLPGDVTYQKKMSHSQHNQYFQDKLMGVRIWRDNSCLLFKELKVHMQKFMNKLANQCHERVHLMDLEPDGRLLAQFRWTPERGEFFSEEDGGMHESSTKSSLPPQRQDDERVRAIQTSHEDLLERDMEKENVWLQQNERNDCSEAVYIAQLHRRALILDQAFKKKVVDSLSQKVSAGIAVVATGVIEIPENQMCDIPMPLDAESPNTRRKPQARKSMEKVASITSVASIASSSRTWNSGSYRDLMLDSLEQDGQPLLVRVEVQFAPIKRKARMHEKLSKYMPPNVQCEWPLSAYITDAVRLSLVCNGPAEMLRVIRWFLESQVCLNKIVRSNVFTAANDRLVCTTTG